MKKIVYRYKDGRYLTTNYIGDGDYEIVLTKRIEDESWVNEDWPLSEILDGCDGVYDERGEFITDGYTMEISDFITIRSEKNN
jgi:hypothetical protein